MTVSIPDGVSLYKMKAKRNRVGGYTMESGKVRLFGPIDSWERSSEVFAQDLDALAEGGVTEADFEINSFGGSVVEALAIYDIVKASPIKFRAVILGAAASAASLVACACDEIVIGKNARFMIHEPETGTWGRVKDLKEAADMLLDMLDQAANIYAEKSGQALDVIKSWMEETKWFKGQEAVDSGFASSVLDIDATMELDEDVIREFDNVPADIIDALQETVNDVSEEETQEVVEEVAEEKSEEEAEVEAPQEEEEKEAEAEVQEDPVLAEMKSGSETAPVTTARDKTAEAGTKAKKGPSMVNQLIAERNRKFGQF